MSNESKTEWVSLSQYARFKGVTLTYVRKWVAEFKVPQTENKLDLEVAERYWHKRPQSRQKKIDFDEARTKKMEADARLAEMSADTMASQLVETASVVETWERSFAKIKTKMTALPNKMGPILAVQDDPKICTNQLKNAINKILNELASNARRRNTRRAEPKAS